MNRDSTSDFHTRDTAIGGPPLGIEALTDVSRLPTLAPGRDIVTEVLSLGATMARELPHRPEKWADETMALLRLVVRLEASEVTRLLASVVVADLWDASSEKAEAVAGASAE